MNSTMTRLPLPAYFLVFGTLTAVLFGSLSAATRQDFPWFMIALFGLFFGGYTTYEERKQRRRGDFDARVRYGQALRSGVVSRDDSGDIDAWPRWITADLDANRKGAVFSVPVLALLGASGLAFSMWWAATVLLSIAAIGVAGFYVRRRQLTRLSALLQRQ